MKTSTKIVLVVGGYLAAVVVAAIAVAISAARTAGPVRDASSGMYAFGDAVLFLSTFTLAAVPATCAGLFFLRPYPLFWRVLATGALALAATGVVVLVDFLVMQRDAAHSFLGAWATLSPIRVILAPLLAIAVCLCALFAPTRFTRFAFLGAAAIETVVFVWVAFVWFQSIR